MNFFMTQRQVQIVNNLLDTTSPFASDEDIIDAATQWLEDKHITLEIMGTCVEMSQTGCQEAIVTDYIVEGSVLDSRDCLRMALMRAVYLIHIMEWYETSGPLPPSIVAQQIQQVTPYPNQYPRGTQSTKVKENLEKMKKELEDLFKQEEREARLQDYANTPSYRHPAPIVTE